MHRMQLLLQTCFHLEFNSKFERVFTLNAKLQLRICVDRMSAKL